MLLLRDVAQRGDGAEQLPLDHERCGRNGNAALLAVGPHHLRLVVLLLTLERAVLALGHVLALGRGDHVVDRGAGEVFEGATEQLARRSIGSENPTVGPGQDRKSTRLNSRSLAYLVCRLLLEKKKKKKYALIISYSYTECIDMI